MGIKNAVEQHIFEKKLGVQKSDEPVWFIKSFRVLVEQLRHAYHKYEQFGMSLHFDDYKIIK